MSEKRLKKLIDNQKILVAIKNNNVIGFMITGIKDRTDNEILVPKKYLVIDILAIDKNYRRQGIGTELIEYAEKSVRKIGCTDLYITVSPENQKAINCYEKQEFKIKNIVYSKSITK